MLFPRENSFFSGEPFYEQKEVPVLKNISTRESIRRNMDQYTTTSSFNLKFDELIKKTSLQELDRMLSIDDKSQILSSRLSRRLSRNAKSSPDVRLTTTALKFAINEFPTVTLPKT